MFWSFSIIITFIYGINSLDVLPSSKQLQSGDVYYVAETPADIPPEYQKLVEINKNNETIITALGVARYSFLVESGTGLQFTSLLDRGIECDQNKRRISYFCFGTDEKKKQTGVEHFGCPKHKQFCGLAFDYENERFGIENGVFDPTGSKFQGTLLTCNLEKSGKMKCSNMEKRTCELDFVSLDGKMLYFPMMIIKEEYHNCTLKFNFGKKQKLIFAGISPTKQAQAGMFTEKVLKFLEELDWYWYVVAAGVFLIIIGSITALCVFRWKRKKKKLKVEARCTPEDAKMDHGEIKITEDCADQLLKTAMETTQVLTAMEASHVSTAKPPPVQEQMPQAPSDLPPTAVGDSETAKKPAEASLDLTTCKMPSEEMKEVTAQDVTLPLDKTQIEFGPDELEYQAFCTRNVFKRFEIFLSAIAAAKLVVRNHGIVLNASQSEQTLPGDEEEWLKNKADGIVKAVCEVRFDEPKVGTSIPDFKRYFVGRTVKELYLVALHPKINRDTRFIFLNAAIDRFKWLAANVPSSELAYGRHPVPALLRAYNAHPELFQWKAPPPDKAQKPKRTKK